MFSLSWFEFRQKAILIEASREERSDEKRHRIVDDEYHSIMKFAISSSVWAQNLEELHFRSCNKVGALEAYFIRVLY